MSGIYIGVCSRRTLKWSTLKTLSKYWKYSNTCTSHISNNQQTSIHTFTSSRIIANSCSVNRLSVKFISSLNSRNNDESVCDIQNRTESSDGIYESTKGDVDVADISEDEWLINAPERRIELTGREQKQLLRQKPVQPKNPRILKVAIVGAPNAGKSTLANQLLGWRYSAVSSKVHTTRHKSIGVLTEENTQIVFLDTPGMISPEKRKKHRLDWSLLTDPHSTLYEADIIIVVVDVSQSWNRSNLDIELLKALHLHKDKHMVLIQNKTDLYGRKKELLHTTRILTEGFIGGRNDWFKPIQKSKKVNLDTLFDKVDHIYNRKANNNEDKTDFNKLENEELLNNWCNKDESGVYFEKTTDCNLQTETIEYDSNSNVDAVQQESSLESQSDEKLNLENRQEWQQYYNQKLRIIEREVQDKKGYAGFARVFHISALHHSGVSEIKDYLIEHAKPGPWLYNESVITDLNPITIAKMCVWEKLLDHLPKEVPYTVDIKLSLWEVDESGMLRAVFELTCKKRDMFKVLGGDGSMMQKIAREAKQELMNTFRREMSLKLIVKSPGGSQAGLDEHN